MPSNLQRGILAEREAAVTLRQRGYVVTRSAASRGFDLIATNRREIIYISVKSLREPRPSLLKRAADDLRTAPIPITSVVKRQLWVRQPWAGWRVEDIS